MRVLLQFCCKMQVLRSWQQEPPTCQVPKSQKSPKVAKPSLHNFCKDIPLKNHPSAWTRNSFFTASNAMQTKPSRQVIGSQATTLRKTGNNA